MKLFRPFLCLGLGVTMIGQARAQGTSGTAEPNFAALAAEHERALAAVDAPIDQRYQATLMTLLAHAQRDNDVDMTAAIQQALARLLITPATVGAGVVGSSATATKTVTTPGRSPTATAPTTAATPTPDPLSPVGKWRWHAGPDHTLTDKGAVLQDSMVVGQWRWTNKDKGELQIQWSGLQYRPPVTYTVSPHGNHLNGSEPGHKDRIFAEERIE